MVTATIDNKVKQVVSNIRNLPTPPIVFHQIQKVINDPKVSAGQIAKILSEDPAMSVKVLKLTNSAFYGLSREVESVKQAVVIVGLEAIKNLVLSASVLDMFKGDDFDQEFQEKFWRHSLAVGFCGRILARKVRSRGMIDPDSAFSGGLLHDIGKMVLCCFLKDEFAQVTEEQSRDRVSATYEIEERVLGYNHAQLGAILAGQWKLPERLTEAIAFHHQPQLTESEDPIAYFIHVANYLAKKTFYDKDDEYLINDMEPGVTEYLQIDEATLESLSEALREEYLKAETFMKMAGLS
ncbi:MAG: HDOD domain-containing protein [candidate division Zixibacteria bacterium]|nr:HDOD domain-containing protein [candidate division Zixibacteria bacterium]